MSQLLESAGLQFRASPSSQPSHPHARADQFRLAKDEEFEDDDYVDDDEDDDFEDDDDDFLDDDEDDDFLEDDEDDELFDDDEDEDEEL